jgi:hypothetical protein
VPLTPVGRLEAMEKRLEAMLQAAKLVQPALDEFYATLSSEQKARFNTLGQLAGPLITTSPEMQMGVLGRALCFCSRAVCSIPSVDLFSRGVVGRADFIPN